nr:unnamed protein product [Callosobruchus chinensis]
MATAQAINPGARPRKNLKRSEFLGWCLCVVFLCGFCVCVVLQKCGFQPSLFSWAWDQQSGLEESTLARFDICQKLAADFAEKSIKEKNDIDKMDVKTFYGRKKNCASTSLNRLLVKITDIYIAPPSNDSEGDSEGSDADDSDEFANKFSSKILSAPAEASLKVHGNDIISSSDDESEDETCTFGAAGPSTSKILQTTSFLKEAEGRNSTLNTTKGTKRSLNYIENIISESKIEKVVKKSKKTELLKEKWNEGDLMSPAKENINSASVREITLSRPVDLFERFWTSEFFEYIKKQTINYSRQVNPNSTFELSVNEVKVFFAILMISGYSPKPRRDMYWSLDADLRNEAIADAMPRNRFREILKYIHFADNTHLSKDDKFGKVRPLIDHLNKKFLENLPKIENVDVDESMLQAANTWQTHQIWFQILVHEYVNWLSDNTEPYQGKGTQLGNSDLGLGASVVTTFAERLKGAYPDFHFNFFIDNFFTGLPLLRKMTAIGFGCTGTIRGKQNRKLPSEQKRCKAKAEGLYKFFVNEDKSMIVIQWKDNSTVQVASNAYGVLPTKSAKRYSAAEKKNITVDMPNAINLYNENMGGTDLMDRNISNYRIKIRNNKWYWQTFTHLLSASASNA